MKYMLLISQGTTPTTVDPEAWTTLFEDERRDTDMSRSMVLRQTVSKRQNGQVETR
jgi:hypothetical protein